MLEHSMQEIDTELEEISIPEEIVNDETVDSENVTEEETTQEAGISSEHNHLQIIEMLNSLKLSSQIRDVVEKTGLNHRFSVKLEKIESTLLAPDLFRGGKTIIGKLIDDDSIEVELLFQPEANDSVDLFKINHTVDINAHIQSWNIGRKRAVFSVNSFDYE